MAGQDKAMEESTFAYKNCCNDETGIFSRNILYVKFDIISKA